MSAQPIWSGDIPANKPKGTDTGINVSQGDELTILAQGWIKYGKEEYALAVPFGRIKTGLQTKDDKVLKARLSETGKTYHIGNGVYKWQAPESGTLQLFVADTDAGYTDNTGSFTAEVYK